LAAGREGFKDGIDFIPFVVLFDDRRRGFTEIRGVVAVDEDEDDIEDVCLVDVMKVDMDSVIGGEE